MQALALPSLLAPLRQEYSHLKQACALAKWAETAAPRLTFDGTKLSIELSTDLTVTMEQTRCSQQWSSGHTETQQLSPNRWQMSANGAYVRLDNSDRAKVALYVEGDTFTLSVWVPSNNAWSQSRGCATVPAFQSNVREPLEAAAKLWTRRD